MKTFFKKFGAILGCLMVAAFVVINSNFYFNEINNSDVALSGKTKDLLDEFYANATNDKNMTDNTIKNSETDAGLLPSLGNNEKPEAGGGVVDKVPEFTDGVQAFLYANKQLKKAETIQILTNGTVYSAGTTQKVKNTRIRDAQKRSYYNAISYSPLVSVALEAYNNGNYFVTNETKKVSSSLVPTFDASYDIISGDDFRGMVGFLPDEPNYVVTNQSVQQCNNFSNNGRVVKFSLVLDNSLSVSKYRNSVKHMSGSNEYPKFSHVELQVEIDAKTGNFKSIISHNTYSVKILGLSFECEETLTDMFYINKGSEITVPSWSK